MEIFQTKPAAKMMSKEQRFVRNRDGSLIELEDVVSIAEKIGARGCGGTIFFCLLIKTG